MAAIAPEAREPNPHGPETAGSRPATLIELIAIAALAFSTIVALTAVSIGIARADAFGGTAAPPPSPLATETVIGFVLWAMGALTLATAGRAVSR